MSNKLPIEEMSEDEFDEFKDQHLCGRLSKEALEKIRELFKVGDPSTGYICCDEMHGHSTGCVRYKVPMTGVVDQLVLEVKHYQGLLQEIHDKTAHD